MHIHEFRESSLAAQGMAFSIIQYLANLKDGKVILASGNTTKPVYEFLCTLKSHNVFAPENFDFYHLDEFVDAAADKSFARELERDFIEPLGATKFHPWRGQKRDVGDELEKKRTQLGAAADLCLLGIGENGHIGFNEPGSAPYEGARLLKLTDQSRRAHKTRFGSMDQVPKEAIGFGIAEILAAKKILLIATGEAKAQAIAQAFAGPVSWKCPASFLQLHPNVEIFLDAKAAQTLRKDPLSFRADAEVLDQGKTLEGGILFLSPHPDDCSIAAGGLLHRHASKNRVRVINCFSGHRAEIPGTSIEERVKIRQEESRNEAKILGIDSVFAQLSAYENNYAFNDADLSYLREKIIHDRPHHIFIPRLTDPHPAHSAVAKALWTALVGVEKINPLSIWFYETPWSLFQPKEMNVFVPLGSTEIATKLKAIGAHRSQVSRTPYDYAADALARLRATISREQSLSEYGKTGPNLGKHVECFQRIQIS